MRISPTDGSRILGDISVRQATDLIAHDMTMPGDAPSTYAGSSRIHGHPDHPPDGDEVDRIVGFEIDAEAILSNLPILRDSLGAVPLPPGSFAKGERSRTIATIFETRPDRSYQEDCYRAFSDGGDAIMSTHIRETSGLSADRFKVTGRTLLASLLPLFGLLCSLPAAAQDADGARLFQQRCATCHSVVAGQNKTGPHLSGAVGRRAGTVEGATYSDALRSSGITWDSQSLDTFLTAPGRMVRGTRMTVAIPNAGQRAAIIQYLESQSAN